MKTFNKVHFVGIGGSGLSALARIYKGMGKTVSGSDSAISPVIEELKRAGIKIEIGHKSSNIQEDTDLVVYTQAVNEDNPEVLKAKELGINLYSYPQALGELTKSYKTIAVCGTHGKTTTTGMIGSALVDAGLDPTILVGSDIHELQNSNARIGKSNLLVIEACEYRRAFLNYEPHFIVLTNLEPDHFDYYKTFKDYLKAFREFIEKLPENGTLIANSDDESVRSVMGELKNINIVTFGKSSETDYHFDVIKNLNLSVPGEYNKMNALAAYALCMELGADKSIVVQSLQSFKGAARRFEFKGKIGKTQIYDDYAHHPTAIKAALKAAREKFGKKTKILCVFQPHQYSRTFHLLKEFGKAFSDADEVIIPNIYGVRDSLEDEKSISAEDLVKEISKNHKKVFYGEGLEKTAEIIKNRIGEWDFVFTMGAGDVWKLNCLMNL
jgi:UDP-N-acetylmuramate--alanine ligase